MTTEERLERLENFMGDIDRITSLYANSVQEICDKYLNILYIETPDENNKNVLIIDGFLGEIDLEEIPKNVVFNVRPSHDFAFQGEVETSKIRFKRDNKYIEIALKKYDVNNPGNLIFLEPNDYLSGNVYTVYINSQGIAVISSSDTGVAALQAVHTLTDELTELSNKVEALKLEQDIESLTAGIAEIRSLVVTQGITLSRALNLPAGSTCSAPTADNQVANLGSVRSLIASEINNYHQAYHIFGSGDPSVALNNAKETAIFYKFGD